MKANNRTFKKYVTRACGNLAAECLFAATFDPKADQEKLAQIVVDIARLQNATLERASFGFDKAARDFANRAEYRKAHRAYYAAAYRALDRDFTEELKKIVDEMNKAVPHKK